MIPSCFNESSHKHIWSGLETDGSWEKYKILRTWRPLSHPDMFVLAASGQRSNPTEEKSSNMIHFLSVDVTQAMINRQCVSIKLFLSKTETWFRTTWTQSSGLTVSGHLNIDHLCQLMTEWGDMWSNSRALRFRADRQNETRTSGRFFSQEVTTSNTNLYNSVLCCISR